MSTGAGQRGDAHRIEEIIAAIDRIERWRSEAESAPAEMFHAAVLRELGVIGEAAVRLHDRVTAAVDAPWRSIRGMQNLLLHDYRDIPWPFVEETIERDLPALRAAMVAARSVVASPAEGA